MLILIFSTDGIFRISAFLKDELVTSSFLASSHLFFEQRSTAQDGSSNACPGHSLHRSTCGFARRPGDDCALEKRKEIYTVPLAFGNTWLLSALQPSRHIFNKIIIKVSLARIDGKIFCVLLVVLKSGTRVRTKK